MKRIKTLEHPWIFKKAFYVNAYTVMHSNGKKYVVYAHDFNDMKFFLSSLDCLEDGIATYTKDGFDHFEEKLMLSYLPNKKGEPKKKPFWYRGRIYELINSTTQND